MLPADFKVSDNGKPMTITEFEKHTLFIPETPQKKPGPSSTGPPRISRRFFLFFDFVFNNPQGLEQAKRAALHFLGNQVQASDEVGVISYSIYKGLTLHEYLTTDHQKVREVVAEFSLKDVLGRAQNLEAEYWNAMKDITGELHSSAPTPPAEGWFNPSKQKLLDLSIDRMNYQLHVRNFVQKMGALAKSLRLIPGYKSLIFFSSGIAGSVFQGAPIAISRDKMAATQRAGDAGLYHMDSLDAAIWEEKKYENMIKELAQANCPVYVLNTEQLGQDPALNKAMSGEYPLKKMSQISGGEYFPRVEDYENSLAQVQDITGTYYVLGYPIKAKEDGKFHEIKVKVLRKGCEVRAQGGYFNPKPFREFSEFEKTLHLMDVVLTESPQLQSPAGFPMSVLACPVGKEPLLVLLSQIPREIFVPAGKGQNEVVSLILDSQKNIVDFKRAEVNFAGIAQPALCHYTFSLQPEMANSPGFSPGPAEEVRLSPILNKAIRYCRRLERAALDFVCLEEISENIDYSRDREDEIAIMPRTMGERGIQTQIKISKRKQENTYLYDFQFTRKGELKRENRNLLEKNGKPAKEKDAPLETSVFQVRNVLFGPLGLLSENWQGYHDYQLVGEEEVHGEKIAIIDAAPKKTSTGTHGYGRIWVKEGDGSLLKIGEAPVPRADRGGVA